MICGGTRIEVRLWSFASLWLNEAEGPWRCLSTLEFPHGALEQSATDPPVMRHKREWFFIMGKSPSRERIIAGLLHRHLGTTLNAFSTVQTLVALI